MRLEVSAHEVRCAGADTPARRAFLGRKDDVGVTCETEIIVARERDELATVNDYARPLWRPERAPGPLPSVGFPRRETGEETGDQVCGHTVRISPAGVHRRESEAREQRAVGGDRQLPVVSICRRRRSIGAGEKTKGLDRVAHFAPSAESAPSRWAS